MRKLNRLSDRGLLWIHAAIGFFVALAHGGFLLLARAGKAPLDEAKFTYITIPIALIVLASAIVAILRLSLRANVLKFHAVVLGLAWLGAMYFSVQVAVVGIPPGVNFVWNPVFFAFVAAYPIYLVQRAFPALSAHEWAVVAPVWAVAASVVLSAVVMWRIANVAT